MQPFINRFLVHIGWRPGRDAIRFVDAPFRMKLAFVLVVSVTTALIAKYAF
jgi:hypothetical protein